MEDREGDINLFNWMKDQGINLDISFEWVTNHSGTDIRSFTQEVDYQIHKGPPKATEKYSEEELVEMGMIGIYRKKND